MKKYKTADGRSEFTYEGTIKNGTTIHYGTEAKMEISPEQWQDLISNFKGKTIPLGTSRTEPVGLGQWLHDNITGTAIASYIGRILEVEGYAELFKSERAVMIRFRDLNYEIAFGPDISPDSESQKRGSYSKVVLKNRL